MMKKLILSLILTLGIISAHAQFIYPIYNPTWYDKLKVNQLYFSTEKDTSDITNPVLGLMIFQSSDSTLYLHKKYWSAVGELSGYMKKSDFADSINAYIDTSEVLYLSDSTVKYVTPKQLRDSLNGYQTLDSLYLNGKWITEFSDDSTLGDGADNVIPTQEAVKSALNNLTNAVNVLNFGAKGDSLTPSASAINAAINYQSSRGGGVVYIPPGKYVIDTTIWLKDNITLLATGADIYLADGANDYMVANADFYGGNKNIIVNGGTWHGNAHQNTQLRVTDSSHLQSDWYGFGFAFCGVTDLIVKNLEIDSTQTWAIGYFQGERNTFQNLEFHQMLRRPYNGDGVTGYGNNTIIDNIWGYTNDDMVAIAAGSQSEFHVHGLYESYWPLPNVNVHNAIVRNVNPQIYDSSYVGIDSAYTHRALRIHAADGAVIYNTTVDNIWGETNYAPIILQDSYNFAFGPGITKNVNISNVNVTCQKDTRRSGTILILGADIEGAINVSNITRFDTSRADNPLISVIKSRLNTLNVSNFSNLTPEGLTSTLILDSMSFIKNVNVSNGINADTSGNLNLTYYKFNDDSITNLKLKNVVSGSIDAIGDSKISMQSLDIVVDTDEIFSPQDGDYIMTKSGPMFYYNNTWNNLTPLNVTKNDNAPIYFNIENNSTGASAVAGFQASSDLLHYARFMYVNSNYTPTPLYADKAVIQAGGYIKGILFDARAGSGTLEFAVAGAVEATINSSGFSAVAVKKTGGTGSEILMADGTTKTIPVYSGDSFSGDGTTTSFIVNISPGFTPSNIIITPTTEDAAKAQLWVDKSTITSTQFTVKVAGTVPPSGTDNVKFDYQLIK